MSSRNVADPAHSDQRCTEHSATERCLLEYEAAAEAARNAIATMTSVRQRMDDLKQRKAAACADAESARSRWSRLLRESGGVLTTDLEDLRASERSSLSLADEYQAMHGELETSLMSSEATAAGLAAAAIGKRGTAVSAAAEDVFNDLLQYAGAHFKRVYLLFERADADTVPARQRRTDEEVLMEFVSRLAASILQKPSPAAQQTYDSIGISELKIDDIPGALIHSPTRRSMLMRAAERPRT